MDNLLLLITALLLGYLAGSFPTAYIVGKVRSGIDIRDHGTKNMGASNVHLVFGIVYGAAVMVIDTAKGLIAVLIGRWLVPDVAWVPYAAGTMAVFGHVFPIFAGFRGGKGAATIAGVALGIHFLLGLGVLAVYGVIGFIVNTLAISSMLGFLLIPVVVFLSSAPWPAVLWSAAASALCIYRHWPNLQRYRRGEEIRFRDGLLRKQR